MYHEIQHSNIAYQKGWDIHAANMAVTSYEEAS